MDCHMDWLLSLANSLQSNFLNIDARVFIKKYLLNVKQGHFLENSPLLKQSIFVLFAPNPIEVFKSIAKDLSNDLTDDQKIKFKPIIFITKLVDREYVFDVAGSQMIYGIKCEKPTDAIIKAAICQTQYAVSNYFNNLSIETRLISDEILQWCSPENVIGGKPSKHKKIKTSDSSFKHKLNIIQRMMGYIRNNPILNNIVAYANTTKDIDQHALDIIYSDPRAKDAIIDYLKLLINEKYSDYKFEYNAHPHYEIPLDFRLKKFSCMMRHRDTNKIIYLTNMFNSACYEPIPCFREIYADKTCELYTHPLVQLRLLYIDLHFLQISNSNSDHFKRIIGKMLQRAYDQLCNKQPDSISWLGYHKDVAFDRNRENMRSNATNLYEHIFI